MTQATTTHLSLLLLLAVLTTGACQTVDQSGPSSNPEIRVEPQLEQHLYSISRIVLEDVTVSQGVLEKRYPGGDIGTPCLIVQGLVRNMDLENGYVAMFAYGYDRAGERVARTFDADPIPGQITLFVPFGETETFTLHLNVHDDIETIRIFGYTYDGAPPEA